MLRTTILLLLVASSAAAAAPAGPDYQRDVAPILNKYCVSCHAKDEPENGLVLETYDALLKGGKGGAAIVAGSAERSRLLAMVEKRAEPFMPPKGNEAPTADEIAVLRRWIETGAMGPTGKALDPTNLIVPKIAPRVAVQKGLTAAAFSPDGKTLALGSYGEVQLVDVDSQVPHLVIKDIRGSVTALAFAADGKRLAIAAGEPGMFGEATIWHLGQNKLEHKIVGHKDNLYSIALDPQGKLVATGSYDQQIKLWNLADGKEVRTITGHNGAIFDLAFRPDGKALASASADRTIKLWDVATGNRLDTLSQPLKEQNTLAFSPDGTRLAGGGVDNRIRIWKISPDAAEGTNPLLTTRFAHEGAVLRLVYSRDGKTLVSAGEDRVVRIWETKNYTERRQLPKQSDLPQALALAADQKTLAIGRLDGSWSLVDASTAKPIMAPKPELLAVVPRGIERGKPSRLVLQGKHLDPSAKVVVRGGNIADQQYTARLDSKPGMNGELAVELTLANSVPRGNYTISLTSARGASAELPLYVDDLPQRVESEPNNASTQATPASLPASYWGVVDKVGDQDLYQFEASAGDTIVLELSAKRIGSSLNGTLVLLDPHGEVVANNNDFDGQSDPLIGYTIPKSGKYTARVHDLTMNGMATSFYRLSIGKLPYVVGVYPLSVPVGRETKVELLGYNLPKEHRVAVIPKAAGEVTVALDEQQYRQVRSLSVMATADAELLEHEPNDDAKHATPLPAIGPVGQVSAAGRIGGAGQQADVDLFRFEADAGQQIVIETQGARRGSPIDTRLEVLDAAGRPVERVILQAVLDSSVTFRPITSEALDVRVTNWQEMELNQWLYLQGEVCKIFRLPQGPDSGFQFYSLLGKRVAYFDTSAVGHALDEPCYVVEAHQPGTSLLPNGLPVFKVYYANDDSGDRRLGSDSRILFTAPKKGTYLVRVSDVRGFGGDRYAYRLTLHTARPDFNVTLVTQKPTINKHSGASLLFRAERIDGFDGDIRIDLEGLPPGYTAASPITVQAGHHEARSVLNVGDAAADADWSQVKIVASAPIAGKPAMRPVNETLGPVKLEDKPSLRVMLEPSELTIAPGTTITARLKIERNGFEQAVQFDVQNLPHGVIVDNIGLNGILIPAGQTERQLFLTAADWVPDVDRYCFAEAKAARGAKSPGPQASPPLMLHVRANGGALAERSPSGEKPAAPAAAK